MLERDLVRKIKKAVKDRCPDAYVVKLADRTHRGLPDLIIQVPVSGENTKLGVVYKASAAFWVETKAKDGRVSKIQEAEHRKIRAAGGLVCVARSVEEVMNFLSLYGA